MTNSSPLRQLYENVLVAPWRRSRAMGYLRRGEFIEAEEQINKLIEFNPDNGEHYWMRALLRMIHQDLDTALRDVSEALARDKSPLGQARAYTLRGIIYAGQGETQLAVADFGRAITASPAQGRAAHVARGDTYIELDQPGPAIEDYSIALRYQINVHDIDKANVYLRRGSAYAEMGDYTSAMADFERAQYYYKQNGAAYIGWGTSNIARSDVEGRLAQFADIVRTERGGLTSYLTERGMRSLRDGDVKAALQYWNMVVSQMPEDPAALSNRAYVRLLNGEADSALSDADAAILKAPHAAATHGTRGHVYFVMGRYQDALVDFQRARGNAQDEVSQQLAMAGEAAALYRLGRHQDARDLWTTLIQKNREYRSLTLIKPLNVWTEPMLATMGDILNDDDTAPDSDTTRD